jgi:hypothetical protein
LSTFSHGFEREITRKITTKGSCIHPQPKRKGEALNPPQENHQENALKTHQKGKTGETTKGLEESRRIFYTYQEKFIQGLCYLPIFHTSLKISP